MLLIVDSIPLRVTDLSSDDGRNRKLSLFKTQFNPRLCCYGLSSDSKSRSFRLVARSSDGKADITLGSFEANLCR